MVRENNIVDATTRLAAQNQSGGPRRVQRLVKRDVLFVISHRIRQGSFRKEILGISQLEMRLARFTVNEAGVDFFFKPL